MSQLMKELLYALGDIAGNMDCERPEQMLAQIIAKRKDVDAEELERLKREMNTMQEVVGGLALRVRDIEKEKEKPKTHVVEFKRVK